MDLWHREKTGGQIVINAVLEHEPLSRDEAETELMRGILPR